MLNESRVGFSLHLIIPSKLHTRFGTCNGDGDSALRWPARDAHTRHEMVLT
jgi:hypothetical protein